MQKMFCLCFRMRWKKIENVKRQFVSEGINPKQHGNAHQKCHSSNFDKRLHGVNFIQSFSENNALVLPGRLNNDKNPDLKLLPRSMTKRYVYSLYTSASTEAGKIQLSWSLFRKVCGDFCHNVVIHSFLVLTFVLFVITIK